MAMSYLYKRSNRFWHLLIRHHLVHAVWWPMVEFTRIRHLRFRRTLAEPEAQAGSALNVLPAGV